MRLHLTTKLLAIGLASCALSCAAQAHPRRFVTSHATTIAGQSVSYEAAVEEYLVNSKRGKPELSLFATSYIRTGLRDAAERPVIFMFNGGPSGAATGLHMQFGPMMLATTTQTEGHPIFANNPESLLNVADLVMFDPAESGFSRVLPGGNRSYFYSTAGDADSLAQLIIAWQRAHHRQRSPLYLMGESYGSIRQVVTTALLAKRGIHTAGEIIFGNSIFLMETSRRTHNIISTAVSLPMLALTAAYHGKADRHGKNDEAFIDEVYTFAMQDYLPALAAGYTISDSEKRRIAERLGAYTGIPATYYMAHDLTIAKQDFNRLLLPGKVLDADDTRIASVVPAPVRPAQARARKDSDPFKKVADVYTAYMRDELAVHLPGLGYWVFAPDSFDTWDWGNGCDQYLQSAGLCNPKSDNSSVFVDYDWPEVLKRQFADPHFRTMIVAGEYDGLANVGSQLYLAAQLGYPKDRFKIYEYPAGHATAADPKVRPQVVADIRAFVTNEP